jgi:hypothetical protein
LLELIEDQDAGHLPEKVWISRYLFSQDAQRTSKSEENPELVSFLRRGRGFSPPDTVDPIWIHVVKLGSVRAGRVNVS